ncbi:tetratricopeptide repeat protein [Dongia deserti]|uniref:tetratricopeptide repeat protein n=1 Tax=Dongia deserti TaxID=2268030 RepID=UPI000E657001|nr:tetratricopeptide repeat protein [Dongia deserti]
MVKRTTRLLGSVALALAMSGCATVADKAAKPAEKTADVEPTLRRAAMMAERNASYGEAAQHYAALHARYPQDKAITLAVARNLRFSGNPQKAIAVINSSASGQAPDALTLLELGKDYLAADQLNLAKPTLERAKAAAPLNWEILSSLGVVYDYDGEYAQAQQQYDAALFLDPENPTVLNNKALSLAQQGRLDEAVATMKLATDQPSASAQARQNLALLMALKGDAETAERLARKDLPPAVAEANIEYYRSLAKPEQPAKPTQKARVKPQPPAEDDDLPPPPPPPLDY